MRFAVILATFCLVLITAPAWALKCTGSKENVEICLQRAREDARCLNIKYEGECNRTPGCKFQMLRICKLRKGQDRAAADRLEREWSGCFPKRR
jgi:hypothetical protein